MLHTSTAQLKWLLAVQHPSRHSALLKWEAQLQCSIRGDIWQTTWLPYRSPCENAFFWQLIYTAIATQKWRFQSRPEADESCGAHIVRGSGGRTSLYLGL